MFDFALDPAYRLVDAFSQFTGAELAIVLVTLAVRLSLLPLSVRVARAQRIRARLAPQVDRLRGRWRNDPQRLLREVNALYAKEGVGRFTGYLPAFAQWPFFTVTYRLFTAAVIAGHPNLLLTQSVLGVPLGEHLAAVLAGPGLVSPAAGVFAALLALLVAVAVIAARRVEATAPMRRIQVLMPFWTVLAAAFLPLAAGVYLLVSSAWTTAERAVLYPRPA